MYLCPWRSGDCDVNFRRLPNDWSIIHSYTQECWCNIQPVRQRYYTHTGAIFCRLGNNNTESAWQSAAGRVNLPQLLRDRWAIFSKIFWFAWNVEQKLFDSRPTVAWPPTTVAWPFSDFIKIFPSCLKRPNTLFDSRPTVAWPPTTVAWPFSDFLQKFSWLLESSKNVVWQ